MGSRIAGIAVLAAVLCTGSAQAATKRKPAPAKLSITKLKSSVAPAELTPGATFTLTGSVRNTGGKASPAILAFTLREKLRGAAAHNLGGAKKLATVKARGSKSFSATVKVPKLGTDKPYYLVACVRTKSAAPATCVPISGTRKTLKPLPKPIAPTPTPTPAPAPAPAPAPPPPSPDGPTYTPGGRSAGDALFPDLGNTGYDAQHYAIDLSYSPVLRVLSGTTTITALATQNLSELSFDFQHLTVSSVTVDGRPATFQQSAAKLVVQPAAKPLSGATFTVVVSYSGDPDPVIDPDGSSEGFYQTEDGAAVVGEPMGAQGWYPVNNIPFDKATYDVEMTVPDPAKVLGNGVLVDQTPAGDGTTTWHWSETHPTASYLVTASIGLFDLTTDTSNPDRPHYIAVDSTFTTGKPTMISRQEQVPAIIDFFEDLYGTYPFRATGGVVDRLNLGYSLETQSKPTYLVTTNPVSTGPDIQTIAHENAHQWFGDSVSPRTWSDIWLNEGLTEYNTWLWDATENGGPPIRDVFDDIYAADPPDMTWTIPPAAPPTAADIFDYDAMYQRGAMVGVALSEILGPTTFRDILRTWLADHAYGAATTAEFIALVKRDGGVDATRLDEFFQQWLYGTTRPTITPDNF